MTLNLTTLPSGLRVVTDRVDTVESVALGVWTGVGSRDEDTTTNGVAHMVEHMMFKGTRTRTARAIAEEAEAAGAHMNAYTGREITAYHMHLLAEDFPLGVDLLSDILLNSTLPDEEVARERHVILQEIGTAHDTPDDLVFDLYQETAYGEGQALGAPILGHPGVVARMERATLAQYISKFYTADRLIVSAAGKIDHDDLVRAVERSFAALPGGSTHRRAPACYTGGEHRREKALEQAHIVLGFRSMSRTDPDFYTAQVLSTLLGGGMSSRLFQEIRERRGLVYSIYSFVNAFADDGQLAIYAGTGSVDLPQLIPVLCDEIRSVCDRVGPDELARAKAQLRANLLMGRESMMQRADHQARHLITFGSVPDIAHILGRIAAVGADDVCRTAARIVSSPPTLAALGPLNALESWEKLRARLAA